MLDRLELIKIQQDYKRTHQTSSKHNEHDLQKAVMRYVKLQYPKVRYFAIPNAGRRTKYERGQLLEEGMAKGVPDTFLAYCNGVYGGLWIEYKNGKKGVLSAEQKEFIDYLNKSGYKAIVCRTFDEAKDAIDSFLI